MNLPSEVAGTAETLAGFPRAAELARGETIAPLEFRLVELRLEERRRGDRRTGSRNGFDGFEAGAGERSVERELPAIEAAKAARVEGFAQGEREGMRRARAEMEAEMHAAGARERERLVAAVAQFGASRKTYFAGIEQEVVKLALGIAARVLHREAQVDPLLLAGAVRVALEKMAGGGGVVLRAAAADALEWETLFHAAEPGERPKIVGDATMTGGECRLETTMGTVELGVRAQLEEIEKGFCDLLEHRPGR